MCTNSRCASIGLCIDMRTVSLMPLSVPGVQYNLYDGISYWIMWTSQTRMRCSPTTTVHMPSQLSASLDSNPYHNWSVYITISMIEEGYGVGKFPFTIIISAVGLFIPKGWRTISINLSPFNATSRCFYQSPVLLAAACSIFPENAIPWASHLKSQL